MNLFYKILIINNISFPNNIKYYILIYNLWYILKTKIKHKTKMHILKINVKN